MKILFVHQNFPAQFLHLAPALARAGHDVVALTMRPQAQTLVLWQGVKVLAYRAGRGTSADTHPWAKDLETKVIRGEACLRAAQSLDQQGWKPDAIVAHPGWGESLFLKDLWPQARLGLYLEFFYRAQQQDVGFDAEFTPSSPLEISSVLRMRNAVSLLHLEAMDAALSPTHWQASTYPQTFRERTTVAHDGINTTRLCANPAASFPVNDQLRLRAGDEVITFVNRNLEPYRGYHIFMRALPEILRRRPHAHVLIVGGDGVSYGVAPDPEREGYSTWKETFAEPARAQMTAQEWSRVHFLGNVPYDVYIAILQVSAVHVYWTYPFVLSWSLLEAMSAGCTIVASDTAPVREVITHGETGYLTDFFDVDEMVRRVCEVLQSAQDGRPEKTGQAAREVIRSRYDLETRCLPDQMAWVTEKLLS